MCHGWLVLIKQRSTAVPIRWEGATCVWCLHRKYDHNITLIDVRHRTNLGSWVDGKFQLRFLAIVNGQTFHQQRSEARTGSTTERMKDKETLKTCALISQFPYPVQHQVDNFLACVNSKFGWSYSKVVFINICWEIT